MSLYETLQDSFKSERLIYRAIEDNDADKSFIHEHILSDPIIQTMSSIRLQRPQPKKSADDLIKFIQDAMLGVMICLPPDQTKAPEQGEAQWGADKPKETPKPIPIGHIAVFDRNGPNTQQSRNGMLGISLAEEYRGKGYGGEAINWALDWAFGIAGLHRVGIVAFAYNPRALWLYRKLGFVDEGVEREAVYHRRAWHDIILLSLLEHEWEELRRKA